MFPLVTGAHYDFGIIGQPDIFNAEVLTVIVGGVVPNVIQVSVAGLIRNINLSLVSTVSPA